MNKVKRGTIDLNKADGYVLTEADIIIEKLKKDGIYKPNLIYRGFNGEMMITMLKTGADITNDDCGDEAIYADGEKSLRETPQSSENPLSYGIESLVPALAVYNGSKLKGVQGGKMFSFKNPKKKLEALVAVYKLKFQ